HHHRSIPFPYTTLFRSLVEYVTGHKIVAVSALLHQVYDKRAGHNIDTEDIGVVMYKTDKNAVGTALFTQSLAGVGNKLSFNIARSEEHTSELQSRENLV